jgi:hypothetical protein
VAGRVVYYKDDRAVAHVQVNVSGASSTETETTMSGNYAVNGVSQGTWSVVPEKMGEFNDGISSLDAAYALQAATRIRSLTQNQQLACDVTGNGSVSALDAARILQLVVGLLPRFAVSETCDSDWLFRPSPEQVANQQLLDPVINTDTCSLGRISLTPLITAVADQDFTAILFGDCTGNWQPGNGTARQAVAGHDSVRLGPMRNDRTGHVRLPVYVRSKQPLSAVEIDLAYEPSALEVVGAEPRRGTEAMLQYNATRPGHVRLALASPTPIDPARGATFFVDFTVTDGAAPLPEIVGARVDERPANVSGH